MSDRGHLTRAEIGLVLSLHRAGKEQAEIAQVIGCSQPTVSYWINELTDTREMARYALRKGSEKLANRIIRDADVDQSLEVLDRLEVLPKRQVESARSAVQINIGMPGLPVDTATP